MTKLKNKDNQNIVRINASGQTIGRLASKVSYLLMGKNKPFYYPNKKPEIKVIIENISDIKFTGKKFDQKKYYHFSGYPGGIKTEKLREIFEKNKDKLFVNVIYNMLPKNRLRKFMIKNLIIKK